MGLAMVEKFKESGWTVAACSTSLDRIKASGADFPFECDVADLAQVKSGVTAVVAKFGHIDALINNAGAAGSNPLESGTSDELWHRIMNVNLNGTYYMSKLVMPHLPDGKGRIINIASVLALKGVPDQTAYCAAKHAVLGFTRSLSHYLAPRKITVNVICPGWTRTDMAHGRMKELAMTEASLKQSVPLGRFIEPGEIADLAFYLASESASGITGQSFTVDGGVLA